MTAVPPALDPTPAPTIDAVLDSLRNLHNPHARWIIGKYDLEGKRPRFARNAVSDRIHVLAPGDTQPAYPSRADALLDFHLGRHVMVCGTVIAFHRGGVEKGGHLVEHFDDNALCRRCHKAFGERAWILFDSNRRPDTQPEETMNRYLVTFDRIGRLPNPTLTTDAADRDALTAAVADFARPHLRSRLFDVVIDAHEDKGKILCGGQIGGRFTFKIAPGTTTETGETADEGAEVAGVASP